MISGIHLHPELKKAFEEMGYSEMTEIQQKAIPLIKQGKDVIGQSQTGSGKTAAFGFPILEMIRQADIVVGTPGRILDHLERGTINFNKVKILVLDEADKMFEMGFVDDVSRIISQTPRERQTLLFSATMSQQVHNVVKNYMKNPEKIKTQAYVEESKMEQLFYSVPSRDKFSLLSHILKHEAQGITIIFCATRNRVDVISKNLYKQGIQALSLHGGLSQNRRKQSIDAFNRGEVSVLVASDVAAKGLDIKNVSHVINYDSPKTSKEYIHRIGRTARAGSEGKVISLIAEQDHDNFRSVLSDRSIVVQQVQLPDFEKISFVAAAREHGRGGGFHGRPSYRRGYGSQPGRGSYGHGHRESRGPSSDGERSGERTSERNSHGSSYSGHRPRSPFSRPHERRFR